MRDIDVDLTWKNKDGSTAFSRRYRLEPYQRRNRQTREEIETFASPLTTETLSGQFDYRPTEGQTVEARIVGGRGRR